MLGLVLLGLWVGSIAGNVQGITPYGLTLVLGVSVILVLWREQLGPGDKTVTGACIIGMVAGGIFGTFANQVPFGIPSFLGVALAAYGWRSSRGPQSSESPTNLFTLILIILISGGFFYAGTFADMCQGGVIGGADTCTNPSNWVNGFPTTYNGCILTCGINTITIFGSSLFQPLLQGNFFAFFIGLFTSVTGVTSIAGIVIGIVLLTILGSGLQLSALSVTLAVNDSGTRMYQSVGLVVLLYSVLNALFGVWLGAIGPFIGPAIAILMPTFVGYAGYLQGKTVLE